LGVLVVRIGWLSLGRQLFPNLPNPPKMGALKVTMQQFYRPNGDSTQRRGVVSDVKLPSISNYMDVSESDLDYAIDFDHIDPAHFSNYHMVTPQIIQSLAKRSKQRISESEDFAKLLRNIERYKEQKAKKAVPLNEKEFFAQRAELDADKEDEKQLEEQAMPSDEVVKRTFYFNEVLAIAADYVRLLEQERLAWVR